MNLQRSFSGHSKHSIFVDVEGKLLVWGNNRYYALGLPSNDASEPQPLVLGTEKKCPVVQQVAVGLEHTLALTRDSQVYVWGDNADGQLGFCPLETPLVSCPTLLPQPDALAGKKISKVACGSSYSMLITQDGSLFSFGDNEQGQLGLGPGSRSTRRTWIPSLVAFPLPTKVIDVACGYNHVVALSSEGHVHVWGQNQGGKLGVCLDDDHCSEFPIKLEYLETIVGVYANFHSMALTRDGALYVWGWGGLGSLGLGDGDNRNSPHILFEEGVVNVACGGGHSLVLLEGGKLLAWGCNGAGQLGICNRNNELSPSPLPLAAELEALGQTPAVLGCLYDHSFLVTNEGDLYMWGLGESGQLGIGYHQNKKRPQKLEIRVQVGVDKEGEWREVFQWLFLGRLEMESAFFVLPQEVIFYFVVTEWAGNFPLVRERVGSEIFLQ
jgi:alpha-tubulin suppressor-like RCC1 family protein